jgi:small subunit ribosomal protein S13
MARIAGINLPKEKRIAIGLTAIYGIGRPLARRILEESKIDQDIRVHALTEEQVNKLRDKVTEFVTEGDLRRKIQLDVKYQQDIGTYRGLRHKKGLPVRGQMTKTNARTRKGKKKTVANKKIATK